jgi:hypothetical protein
VLPGVLVGRAQQGFRPGPHDRGQGGRPGLRRAGDVVGQVLDRAGEYASLGGDCGTEGGDGRQRRGGPADRGGPGRHPRFRPGRRATKPGGPGYRARERPPGRLLPGQVARARGPGQLPEYRSDGKGSLGGVWVRVTPGQDGIEGIPAQVRSGSVAAQETFIS